MKIKEFGSLLTASLSSFGNEGKFSRQFLWKHGKSVVCYEIYERISQFISKVARIALAGIFLSFFGEGTVIDWLKSHWMIALGVFVAYSLTGKLVSVLTNISRQRSRSVMDQELSFMIWQKNESVGIGTRVSSAFRQKSRTAKRCNSYDIESVGLWPIEATSTVITSLALLGTLAWLNWRIGVIFILTSAIVSILTVYMSRWVREKEKTLQESEEKADEYLPASMSIDSTFLTTSKMLFGRARELKYLLLAQKLQFTRRALLVASLGGALTLVVIAIQLYLARESLFEDVSLVKIGITISTMVMAIGSFSDMMRTLFGDQNSIADIREFQEFLHYSDGEKGKNDSSFPMSGRDSIRVIGVQFRYPYVQNSPLVLRGIDLEFFPGEAVAIVGANGSGKTTLGHVLSNIHHPQQGCVMYGNSVISEHTARSVLEHGLVIPQSGDLFDLPLCEQLFGTLDMSSVDMARYSKAIQMSGAKEVLDELPNAIHTQIGTAFTGGTKLSGGQEQRLRLAAYFYKALDPLVRFVLADEPSRYLDPATRKRVYSELIALARDRGKIVVVISHDADLERFDRVVTIEKGRVGRDYRAEEVSQAVRDVSKHLAGDNVTEV